MPPDPSNWQLVHPVLELSWPQLLDEQHPWSCCLEPITKTFTTWESYLKSFFLPTLENFRSCLARKLSEFYHGDIKFRSLTVRDVVKPQSTFVVDDPDGWLIAGDVCLVSCQNPQQNEVGESSEIWDGCGWLLVHSRSSKKPLEVCCEIFSFPFDVNDIVYAAKVDSAITTYRILKSLSFHETKETFAEENINSDLKQLILSCVAPTRPVISTVTFDPRIYGILGNLNESQLVAIHAGLSAVARPGSTELVQGPPGTGKTTCIVAFLNAILMESKRIILVAPTNVAVFDVARKLIAKKLESVHPERILIIANLKRCKVQALIDDNLDQYILSSRINRMLTQAKKLVSCLVGLIDGVRDQVDKDTSCDEETLQEDCLESMQEVLGTWTNETSVPLLKDITLMVNSIRSRITQGVYRLVTPIVRQLQDLSVKRLKQDVMQQFDPFLVSQMESIFVKKATLLFCTLSATKSPLVIDYRFQVAIVDECAQAIEAEMIGLFKESLESLILVGDPKQLHGTVFSQPCLSIAYQRSLFERLADTHPVHLLAVQYRMHPMISQFPNATFYDGRIQDSADVKLYKPKWYSDRFPPMQFIAHKGTSCAADHLGSCFNDEEALLIILHLASFLHTNAKERLSIGIISPYTAQKRLLEQRLADLKGYIEFKSDIKLSTVDGFQGQERDVIIFSLTRVGMTTNFLEQWNRMNVAVTRAKYSLWVFGDSKLFLQMDNARIWCRFAIHCKSVGALGSINPSSDYSDPKIRSLAQRLVLTSKKQELQQCRPSAATKNRPARGLISRRDHHVWRLIASEPVIKELKCCKDVIARAYMVVFTRLLMGDFSETVRPYRRQGVLGKLFLVNKIVSSLVLLWTIEIHQGTQAISALRPLCRTQLDTSWIAFRDQRKEYSPTYISACIVRCSSDAVPQTGLNDIPKQFWRGAGADDAIAGSIKLFDLSDGPLIERLLSSEKSKRICFLLPYMLDETQNDAVQYTAGSIVLVGRGGCGKTSVLAQRILNGYKMALLNDVNPPRQIFVSSSPNLVENARIEFESLIQTFHAQYEEEIDPPDHSGATFVSVLELLLQLDRQLQPHLRLFYEKGSLRRLTYVQEEEEDSDSDMPSRRLYSVDEIVDFDRFRRLYYPHFSDPIRKVFASEYIFTEIMFVIKGGNRTDDMQPLTVKQYCQIEADGSQEHVNVRECQRKLIYDAYKCYERLRSDRHHIDYPDIISDIIARAGDTRLPVDSVLLDEVQDLMPCHWRLLDMFRHPKTQFVCCGDQAQCITAGNRFRFTKLKAFLFESCTEETIRPRQIDLTINYRTTQEVLELANRILDVIRYFFPQEIDRIVGERSARPPPEIWSGKPKLFEECPLDALSFLFQDSKELAAEQIIVVRDAIQKEDLLNLLKSNSWQASVVTILEVKGLEFEDVVLFNILSSAGLDYQRLRVLLNFATDSVVQEYDARKHYELCHFLKELYVAVTRSKHRLLFIDGGRAESQIYVDVFDGLLVWTSVTTEMSFSRSSSADEWAIKAIQYENAGLLREARNAFFKASEFDKATRIDVKLLIREYEVCRSAALLIKASELLLKLNEVHAAATILYDGKLYSEAGELYKMLLPGREQEVIECYVLSHNLDKSIEALQEHEAALDPKVFVKILLNHARGVVASSAFLSSGEVEFLHIIRLLMLVAPSQAEQFRPIIVSLQDFIVKFNKGVPVGIPGFYSKPSSFVSITIKFISILTRFEWIADGVVFFQTRFKSIYTVAIYELLRAAINITDAQRELFCAILSNLLHQFIGQVPVLQEKVTVVSDDLVVEGKPLVSREQCSQPSNPHKSRTARKKEKKWRTKANPKSAENQKPSNIREIAQDKPKVTAKTTVSNSTCKKFLIDRIESIIRSLSGQFDEELVNGLLDCHADRLDSSLPSFLPSIYLALSAYTIALSARSLSDLGHQVVEGHITTIVSDRLHYFDRTWVHWTSLLFDEAARCLQNLGLRCVAGLLFRTIGNFGAAISCFECPGNEKQLLQELKQSGKSLERGSLLAKYGKLAKDFMELGDNGCALFCICRIPAGSPHSSIVRQELFTIWLAKRELPTPIADNATPYVIEQQFTREIEKLIEDINFLPKRDISEIQLCHSRLSSNQPLKESKTAWFVERVIIWVLSSILPEKAMLHDISILTQQLAYVVRLRTGNNIPLPVDFTSFMERFILLKELSNMPGIPFSLLHHIIVHLFACSFVYLSMSLPNYGKEKLLNYRPEIDKYMDNDVIEERAPFVLEQMKCLMVWLKSKNYTEKQIQMEWTNWIEGSRHGIVYALEQESKFNNCRQLSALKRAAKAFGKIGDKRTQNRISNRIESEIANMPQENTTANCAQVEAENVGDQFVHEKAEFECEEEQVEAGDDHETDNDEPALYGDSLWSQTQSCQNTDSKSVPVDSVDQEPGMGLHNQAGMRLQVKAILQKPQVSS